MRNLQKTMGLLLALILLVSLGGVARAGKYPLIDSHLHYLDFLQRTDGFEALVQKMDEANVTHAVLFGMPMAKQWDDNAPSEPTYYLSNESRAYYFSATDYILAADLAQQTDAVKNRFFPFVCGINSNDRHAADYIRQVLALYPDTFVGIGEVMSHHDDLTALTYGEPPHADSLTFQSVYDLAAELDMPVLIHHNISGSYMPEPIYLEEMKRALEHNPKTNIIWAHMGISRRVEVPTLMNIFTDMLDTYPNLYVDISWVVYDDYIGKTEAELASWAAFFEKYNDRVLIGTDIVGHWTAYVDTVGKYDHLLDLLSPEAVDNLTQNNLLRLIHREDLIETALEPAA